MDNVNNILKNLFGKKEEEKQAATVVVLESVEDEQTKKEVPSAKSKTMDMKETKGKVEVKKAKTPSKVQKKNQSQKSTDDSVVSDINKFKSITSKYFNKFKRAASPSVSKGVKSISGSLSSFTPNLKDIISGKLMKRIGGIAVIIILVGVVIYLTPRGLKLIQNNGNGNPVIAPTPTPVAYQPYKPSVYAEDPEILKLQEDANVLKRELSNTNIRESTLNPPSLDYKIRF